MLRYKKLNNKDLSAVLAAENFFLLCAFFFFFCGDLLFSSLLRSDGNTGKANFPTKEPLAAASHVGENESRLPPEHESKKHFVAINKPAIENTKILKILNQGIQEAEKVLNHLPQRKDFSALSQIAFGNANLRSDSFNSRILKFQGNLALNGLGLELELLKGHQLNGALAAYTAHSHKGSERAYLNLDWVSTLSSPERLTAVLLEEAGHAIDRRINGVFDSKGDEGAILAKLIQGEPYENLPLAIFNENDHETVFIDGVGVAIECARAGDVSLVFTEGYIGTMGNNAQKNNSVKSFDTLGISRLTFSQDDGDGNGYFNIQGNDVEGSIKIITDNNNLYTLDAAIVWNDKDGGSVVSFGIFISDVGQSNTTISSSAGDYTLVVGSTKNVSSNISLLGLNLTDPYSDNGNIQGSADNAFLDTLNDYLDASVQISGITASDITEGENLVYNVTLESGAPDSAYYAYNISSTDSTVTNVAFSNGVTLSTVDGTMLVPNGVSSFTVTYDTTDDSTVESTKTATLTAGNLTATANILDNDSVPEIALSGNS
ncbi:MAG TPA: hypothetical protein DIT98_09675, partial [Verrucomicrobiales bacterium]|nr:hypothetical protein [Verrucomicrobiales bacterium]